MDEPNLSRDSLIPFRPIACRNDHLDNDLFVAANFAVAYAASAHQLKMDLNWCENSHVFARNLAAAVVFLVKFVARCQKAIGAVSHQLTAVRYGSYRAGSYAEANAHWVGYRMGIAAHCCLLRHEPLRLHNGEDESRLTSHIMTNWDACQKAMSQCELPSAGEVEAEILWEATQVQAARAEMEFLQRRSGRRPEENSKPNKSSPKRGWRATQIEKLTKAMIEHMRAARDHAYATKEATGSAELLPRPEQKALAQLTKLSESQVSRCLNDGSALHLKHLWDAAMDLNKVMEYKLRGKK